MDEPDIESCVFPLTSLQIGDLQSYLSNLSLFIADESKKMYILVDNRPWLRDLCPRREHLWQYMVTKSRYSPFANNKARRGRREMKNNCSSMSSSQKVFSRWISLIEATMLSRKKILLPVKSLKSSSVLSNELHRTLYGFIIFEVELSGVRGINYSNQLQSDTCLAIEAKHMMRWEFDSISQAARLISSWFSGAPFEKLLMKKYLDSAKGDRFHDANEDFLESIPTYDEESVSSDSPSTEDNLIEIGAKFCDSAVQGGESEVDYTPLSLTGPLKRKKLTRYFSASFPEEYSNISACISESAVEATQYRDVLILYRFNDPYLPFKLREIIISDLRLLTLLEAGLPSWALFLQSYPVLCNIYRPWMCPLVRALYVLISIVTVLIGFYDLYKNVPVLKATASRLFGPLFDWIESWEMVSRVKYLGTMLFLQHFQKAMKWFLCVTQAFRYFVSVLARPLVEPVGELFSFLLPIRNVLSQAVESIFSVICLTFQLSYNVLENAVEIFVTPLSLTFKFACTLVNSILYPIFWMIWELLSYPVRIVCALSGMVTFVFRSMYNITGKVWQFASTLYQLTPTSEAAAVRVTAYEVSMWRSLWNDLFAQVFRAVKRILEGFAAFFVACNRHRLSIYNHVTEFFGRQFGCCTRSRHPFIKRTRIRSVSPTLLILEREDEFLSKLAQCYSH